MNDDKLASIEARLADAEARLAIMDLEAEYARSWDAGDGDGWAAVFTEDGVFDMAEVGSQVRRVVTGTAELAAFCQEVDSFYKGLHFMHLPRIKLSGDIACSRVHFQWIGLFSPNNRYNGQRQAAGYYDVTYRRIGGRWRMQHRLEKAISGQITDNYDVYIDTDFSPKLARPD